MSSLLATTKAAPKSKYSLGVPAFNIPKLDTLGGGDYFSSMSAWTPPTAPGSFPQLGFNQTPAFGPTLTGAQGLPKVPEVGGGWMKGIGMGIQAAEVGLGIFNALEQSKMNKFMKGYYGEQMALQKTDFSNAAKSTNASLEQREQNKLSAQGYAFNSAENKAGVADYMNKWGVKETF